MAWLPTAPSDFLEDLDVGRILKPAGAFGFDQIVE